MIDVKTHTDDARLHTPLWLIAGLASLLIALAATGCGETAGCGSDSDCKGDRVCSNNSCVAPDDASGDNSSSDDNSSSENDSSTNSSSTEVAYCCLNGRYYDCPGSDAVDSCTLSNGPGECTRDGTKDAECGTSTDDTDDSDNSDDTTTSSGGEIGDECQKDADCKSDICIGDPGAAYGYCSKQCDSFSDCPSFWSCEELGDTSTTYCVED